MTPERIAEIADFHTVSLAVKPRMERAIRQAVNEALCECLPLCNPRRGEEDDLTMDALDRVRNGIRALKLPEE